jgi:hypothetical protein
MTCYGVGIIILSVRLVLRKIYYNRLDLGDYLAVLAIFIMTVSLPFSYLAINWGTANIAPILRASGGSVFTPEEIRRRTIGAKSVLVARVTHITV